MSNLHEIYTHLLFFGVGVTVATVWIYKRSRTMRKNPEEKFIEERLKHEKSERDLFEQLQQLKVMIEKIKEHCNETVRVMGDTGNNPYSQGRTIEAKRVLEILGEANGN